MTPTEPNRPDDDSREPADEPRRSSADGGDGAKNTTGEAGADEPRLPGADELSDYRPAQDLFVAFLDAVSEATLGRPLRPRIKVTPAGLARGEIDLVKVELPAFAVAGLVVDRFVIRAQRVRVVPGIPPRLRASPVGLRVVVSQANVDRWTRDLRLPLRLQLTEDGVVTTTGFGGIRMTEVLTDIDVAAGFVRLRPRRASLLGVPTTLVRFLRGYLPLPPLPRNAVVEAVDPSDGEITVTFRIDEFEQRLTPDVLSRLQRILRLPLPGLR